MGSVAAGFVVGGQAMQRYSPGAVVLFGLVLVAALGADSQAPDSRIGTLIKQLGSDRFNEREKARHALEKIGEAALPALRQATKSPDLETSRRATELVRLLEERLTTAKMLAAKRVHLKLKELPVLDAVAHLEKQSGYKIQVYGKPDDRKITLDTGETTFWQALDQLCLRAGLVEMLPTTQDPGLVPPRPPFGVPGLPAKPALPGGILPVVPPAGPQKGPMLQVQGVAGAQVQPPFRLPWAPGMKRPVDFGSFNPSMGNQGAIMLTPGKADLLPTSYAGSVRIRMVGRRRSRPGELRLSLDVAAEPRLQNFSLDGALGIETALDDRGEKLARVSDPTTQKPGAILNMPNMPGPAAAMWMGGGQPMMSVRQASVRLNLGDREVKSLKELKGTLTAKALAATEALITVENVLASAGKTVKGASGGAIQVHSVEKTGTGDYELRVRLENLPGGTAPMRMIAGGGAMQFQQIQIQIGGNVRGRGGPWIVGGGFSGANRMPTLVDKDGKAYQLAGMPSMRLSANNGQVSQEATLLFRAHDGQGAPDRLVYTGQRTVSFSVPFRFGDVLLP
jgi:hypothetical protein